MFINQNNKFLPLVSDKFRKTDENLVVLFTNARDEPNIAEWIAHHLLLGFDKIIVFDHLSKVPISNKLNTNFDRRVTVIRKTDNQSNVKDIFGKEAITMSQNMRASWLLYLDADEYLLLNNITNIKQFLHIFKEADAIGINWLMFGSSNHKTQPKGLLTENFIMSDKRLNKHVKTFVRPDRIRPSNNYNPHTYNIINPNRYYAATGNRMSPNPFNNIPIIFTKTVAYIAHYYVQSEEEYNRRKCRPMDNGTGPRQKNIDFNIHNEVINNQLQNKYSQNTKAFLKKYGIEL
jgi:hypothetical protein